RLLVVTCLVLSGSLGCAASVSLSDSPSVDTRGDFGTEERLQPTAAGGDATWCAPACSSSRSRCAGASSTRLVTHGAAELAKDLRDDTSGIRLQELRRELNEGPHGRHSTLERSDRGMHDDHHGRTLAEDLRTLVERRRVLGLMALAGLT